MNCLFYFVPVASVIALFFSWLFYHQMKKESEGTPTMKEIAQYVREGAMAYLKQQYKVVRFRGAEQVGAFRVPDGRFLFRSRRLCRHEDRYLRFGQDRQRCQQVP